MTSYRFMVLHVNDSNGADLFGWENNGAHSMSSHFQFPKVGRPFQYLDTAVDSWCQANGNAVGISFEVEGFPTEPMNDNQLQQLGLCAAWVHATHGTPLLITDDPINGSGLITHGDGGAAWGGHPNCPGPYRRAQRQQILDIATGTGDDTMTPQQEDELAAKILDKILNYPLSPLEPDGKTPAGPPRPYRWWLTNGSVPADRGYNGIVGLLARPLPAPVDLQTLVSELAPALSDQLVTALAGKAGVTAADVEKACEQATSKVLSGTTFKLS
ncbi:MAG TPA: N-acetylmuramoyl-L-alanine amidase [Jatrophihabitans sp.]|jgi:hypothetical protein